ncbi:MAG: DUF5343 domain-containing protein [Dehalococcoidia bacterium]|nr:DUF5343 domain-containing protein [Dehalococcoidia bacterium]
MEKKKYLAPYVPSEVIKTFLEHIRHVDTPQNVDGRLLQDYGITRGQVFGVLSALKFLGLVESDGKPTPIFRLLQSDEIEDYQNNLRVLLKRAYNTLFSRLDVSRESRETIVSYFARNYSPATAERATRLFSDLCVFAGIPLGGIGIQQKAKPGRKIRDTVESIPQVPTADKIFKGFTPSDRQIDKTLQPGITVHIDSKDLVSMSPQQIQALFEGLRKISEVSNN